MKMLIHQSIQRSSIFFYHYCRTILSVKGVAWFLAAGGRRMGRTRVALMML